MTTNCSLCKYIGAMFTSKFSWAKIRDVLAKQETECVLNIFTYQKSFGYFVRMRHLNCLTV